MRVVIKQNSPEPAYSQVYRQIKEQIVNNELKAGELLPSIRALAKSLRTSVITVKRAYQDLLDEGLITTVIGKGSFVSKVDKDHYHQQKVNEIKINLKTLVKEAKKSGLTLEELKKFLEEKFNESD